MKNITVYIVNDDTKETLFKQSTNIIYSGTKGATYEEFEELIPLLKSMTSEMEGLKRDLVEFHTKQRKSHDRWSYRGYHSDIHPQHINTPPSDKMKDDNLLEVLKDSV